MNKEKVLATLNSCHKEVKKALKRTDLTTKQREMLENIESEICYNLAYVEENLLDTDYAELECYERRFQELLEKLKIISTPVSIVVRPENQIVKVKEVIPEEEQKEETKNDRSKLRKTLSILGIVAIVILLSLTMKCCVQHLQSKNNENLPDEPGFEQIQDDKNKKPIDELDLENYDALMNYAQKIQTEIGNDANITIEDIMYAIRLANFDKLQNKAIFENRDEIYKSTEVIGKVTTELGSDSIIQKDENTDIFVTEHELKDIIMCVTDNKLSLEDFKSAKTEKGYDIYSIADICFTKIYENKETDVLYAKVANDLLARKVIAFSITEESPLSTYYTLLGMYDVNSKRLLQLTSNIGLTSVYGDGERIDGYYGFTCVEELQAYLQVGNKNNVFYTTLVDEHITSHTKGQTR